MSNLLDKRLEDQKRFNEEHNTNISMDKLYKAKEAKALAASRKMSVDIASKEKAALAKEGLSVEPAGGGMSGANKAQMASAALSMVQGDGGGETSSGAGAAGGAAQGALMGASMGGGAVGAGVGAVVGGTIGLLKARSARKQKAREAAARMHQNIGMIEQKKSGEIAGALENIRQGFQSSLIRNTQGIRF